MSDLKNQWWCHFPKEASRLHNFDGLSASAYVTAHKGLRYYQASNTLYMINENFNQ